MAGKPNDGMYRATLHERTTKSGTRFDVRYRVGGLARSKTFEIRSGADRWMETLHRVGPIEAERILDGGAESARLVQIGSHDTLERWAYRFMQDVSEGKGGTLGSYQGYLRNGLAELADVPVSSIDARRLKLWITHREQHAAPKTMKNEHGLLSSVLQYAHDEGAIPRNPARKLRGMPTVLTAPKVILTQPEFQSFAGLFPLQHRDIPLVLVGTGLRWSELTALMPDDIDVSRGSLSVRRAWTLDRQANTWQVGPPKTKKSGRTIDLSPDITELLARRVLGRARDEWLFSTATGRQFRNSTFAQTVWQPVVRLMNGGEAYPPSVTGNPYKSKRYAELRWAEPLNPPISKRPKGPHSLRHMHATWMIEEGVPLHMVQDRLGHESITTTIEAYGQVTPKARDEARSVIQSLMSGMTAALVDPGDGDDD